MRTGAVNVILVVGSLLIAVVLVELISWLVLPLSHGTVNVTIDGAPIDHISVGLYRYREGLVFRQVSSEFDARVTIDSYGNRVPTPVGNPHTIFLGDSFTFGHGLNDDETFVSKYCLPARVSCVNMGRSGTGTLTQIQVLKHYLETEAWRPIEVKVFMLAMTKSLASGNDLLDNYYTDLTFRMKGRGVDALPAEDSNENLKVQIRTAGWLNVRRWLLNNINLVRIVYYRFAPTLRVLLAPQPSEEILKTALKVTRDAFDQLRDLSETFGFSTSIYILHPMQDIIGGTDDETTASLRAITDNFYVLSTADLFRKNPRNYYFVYDGHLNSAGAKRIAEFLLSSR